MKRGITAEEETEANRNAPAAIVECDVCGEIRTIEGTNRHPHRKTPDQSVFDVAPPKGT